MIRPHIHRRLAVGGLLSLLVFGLSRPAAGQPPAARLDLERFRDSVEALADIQGLERLAVQLRAVAERQGDADLALRQGLVWLRLAALGQGHRARDAAGAFELAARLEPSWPLAWYGHGLAQLALARWQLATPQNLGFRVGAGAMEAALESFEHGSALDPTFEPALVEAARVAIGLRRPDLLARARDAFRRARRSGLRLGAEMLLWWGRLERRCESPDSALVAFAAYEAVGGAPGLARLEDARTRLAYGLAGGPAAYYAGAAFDDSVSTREYRADLALIADSAELQAFDHAHGADRVIVLRRFWTTRDHRELRPDGERLRAHYARLHFARTHFYLENTRRHYWQGEPYRSGSEEFDDRAIIYIRHGAPSVRVTPFVYALTANESWRYARPDGDMLFHFTVREDLRDYRLASSIFDLKSTGATPEDQLIMSRQALSPLYSKLGAWGPLGRAKLRVRERELGEASIVEGTSTDSYPLEFDDSLAVRPRLFVVGRSGDKSLVHITVAMDSVASPSDIEGPSPLARVRFAAFDTRERRVAWLDSSIAVLPDGELRSRSVGRALVAVPAGTWRYRLAIQRGERQGSVRPWDSLTVGRFDGRELRVSDLLLGTRRAALTWRPTASDTAYIDPGGVFPRGARVELYYEVYGLESGQPYRTVLEIRRHRPHLHLEFDERAAGPVTRVRRTLDLHGLEPGRYRIWLEAVDRQGRRHRVAAPLRILER